jgi:hypothetical protein
MENRLSGLDLHRPQNMSRAQRYTTMLGCIPTVFVADIRFPKNRICGQVFKKLRDIIVEVRLELFSITCTFPHRYA